MRWLALLVLLVLLAGAGFFIFFLARFNPNDYRPYLESQLSEKLGLRVKLGDLSLTWRGGLGIQVDGLKLETTPTELSLFSAGQVLLHVDFLNWFRLKFVLKGQISNTRLHYWDHSRKPPLDIDLGDLKVTLGQDSWGNATFEAKLLKYGATLKGNALYSEKPPRYRGKFEFNQINLDTLTDVWQWLGEGKGGLSGTAQGRFEFEGAGADPVEIRKSLRGTGFVEIRDGAIRNFNLVDSLLSRITVIPGLQEALRGSPPTSFQQVLKGRDTVFESFRSDFVVEGDHVNIKTANLKAPHYIVQLQGHVGFEGEMDLRGRLEFLEEISDFLIHRVNELAGLNNTQGHIEIPFFYRGTGSSARLLPDVGHLVKKVMVTEGARLLEKGLEALSKYAGEKQ